MWDINRANPLGTGGKLVEDFAKVSRHTSVVLFFFNNEFLQNIITFNFRLCMYLSYAFFLLSMLVVKATVGIRCDVRNTYEV